jgi:hypothetical protein
VSSIPWRWLAAQQFGTVAGPVVWETRPVIAKWDIRRARMDDFDYIVVDVGSAGRG